MSSPKASGDTGSSGNNTKATEPVPPAGSAQQRPPQPAAKTNYFIHLLAIVPILIAFGIYNLPTILDEYNATFG